MIRAPRPCEASCGAGPQQLCLPRLCALCQVAARLCMITGGLCINFQVREVLVLGTSELSAWSRRLGAAPEHQQASFELPQRAARPCRKVTPLYTLVWRHLMELSCPIGLLYLPAQLIHKPQAARWRRSVQQPQSSAVRPAMLCKCPRRMPLIYDELVAWACAIIVPARKSMPPPAAAAACAATAAPPAGVPAPRGVAWRTHVRWRDKAHLSRTTPQIHPKMS